MQPSPGLGTPPHPALGGGRWSRPTAGPHDLLRGPLRCAGQVGTGPQLGLWRIGRNRDDELVHSTLLVRGDSSDDSTNQSLLTPGHWTRSDACHDQVKGGNDVALV
jgi:hypothetical protein